MCTAFTFHHLFCFFFNPIYNLAKLQVMVEWLTLLCHFIKYPRDPREKLLYKKLHTFAYNKLICIHVRYVCPLPIIALTGLAATLIINSQGIGICVGVFLHTEYWVKGVFYPSVSEFESVCMSSISVLWIWTLIHRALSRQNREKTPDPYSPQ